MGLLLSTTLYYHYYHYYHHYHYHHYHHHHHHRSPLYYHPQLIGQIFTCSLSYLYEILEIPSSRIDCFTIHFVSRSPSLVLALFSHPYPPCFLLTIQIHNCFNEPFAVILPMSSPSFTRKRSKESLALAC